MNSTYYVGVDPGIFGAMAMYSPEENKLHIVDMKCKRMIQNSIHEISWPTLVSILKDFIEVYGRPKLAMVEQPHSLPKDGHVGAFTFGKNCGIIEGIIQAFEIPMISVVPASWKPQAGLSSMKSRSIQKAIEIFKDTDIAHELGIECFKKPKRHGDGRAEAAILAWIASNKFKNITVKT